MSSGPARASSAAKTRGRKIHFALWWKVLSRVPRVDRQTWDVLDPISRWLIASRAIALTMTLISCVIAGALAWRDGLFNFPLFLLTTLGLTLAHATNNLINDLVDHRKGVDKDNYFRTQYGPQPVEHGLMTVKELERTIVVTGTAALLIGVVLVLIRGPQVLALLAAGSFFVLFYTYPLKYVGLGEPAVFVVWGPLMIAGGYYVVTGVWSHEVVVASLPYALGVTTVLFGKHIDKCEADRRKGIRTLPVLLGEKKARVAVILMTLCQYLVVFYLVAAGFFSPVMFIVLPALAVFRLFCYVYRNPKPANCPQKYIAEIWPAWYVAFAFWHNRRFGILYLLGLFIEAALVRRGA